MASGLKNIETIESPFRRFVTTIGVFPTAFTDAMTYYECLAYLVKYLEDTVVPAVNENAEALKELQDYVIHYFDNLDVQEEINNKLDQMAEDGTLQEIITAYIQSNVTWTFDTVADMKQATNLVNGSFARTLGFYSVNDGGSALYKITDSGTANEMDVIAIGSLFANIVKSSDTLNVKQIGLTGNGSSDNYSHFVRVGQLVNTLKYKKVVFNPESYKLSDQVDFNISGREIELDFAGSTVDYYPATEFADRHFMIDVIFSSNSVNTVSVIKNGKFTTSGITPDWSNDRVYPNGSGGIVRSYARTAKFDNLSFEDIFFGYPIASFYGSKIEVTNCSGVNVGGRSATGAGDAKGDAIYLAYSGVVYDENDDVDRDNSLPVNIKVDNCNFRAHEAVSGTGTQLNQNHSGRCGICLCEYSQTPQEKNITVSNSYFYNYQRALHSEANENVTLLVTNTVFEDCATILHGGNTITNVEFDNCTFNKDIDTVPMASNYNVLYAGAPTNVTKNVKFTNCIIKGYSGRLTLLASNLIVLFDHCSFEVEELKAMTGGHICFEHCNIKANVADHWYKVITNISNSRVELGYKHDSNSVYMWKANSFETSDDTNKKQYYRNNDFVNCGIMRTVSNGDVSVEDNLFTYDTNYATSLNYMFNFGTTMHKFCRNIINNNSTINQPISGGGLGTTKILVSDNEFNGCTQGFFQAQGYGITLSNNKFDAGSKTISTATDLSSCYIICNNNTYKGYTATSPISNHSTSTLFNNYKIVDNTATLIP